MVLAADSFLVSFSCAGASGRTWRTAGAAWFIELGCDIELGGDKIPAGFPFDEALAGHTKAQISTAQVFKGLPCPTNIRGDTGEHDADHHDGRGENE